MKTREERLEICLLGRCKVLVNETIPLPPLSLGASGILTLLILHRKRPLTRQTIGDVIWDPTRVADSDANFRRGLLVLRQVLVDEKWRLKEYKEGPLKYLRLDLQNARVDVVEFEDALQRAHATNALADWEQAIQMYRGDLLADYDAPWVLPLRHQLREKWLQALEAGAEAAQQVNIPNRAQSLLQTILQASPNHQRVARNLMRLFAEQHRMDEARQVYHALKQSLRESGQSFVEPETAALYERFQKIQRSDRSASLLPAPPQTEASFPRLRRLPAIINVLIGRADEVSQIARILMISRCVTLIGPGGVGKTRLALEIAWNEEVNFRDGVAFVDFSNLLPEVSNTDIHRMVAETLNVREAAGKNWQDRITAELGQRHLLLILDNCEQILHACVPLVEHLLSNCPYVHILATSREPLYVRGERYLQIPPLSYPNQDIPYSQRDILRYQSAQLFLERIALPNFLLTDADVAPLAWLCRTLDGIPLALELAASQLDHFATIENLNMQLRQSVWFHREVTREDIPKRYQVLRETIAWSYNLLSPAEQKMLRSLATLCGGGTIEAIIAVADLPDSVALLPRLLRKSLLSLALHSSDETSNAPQRYRLTEAIRQYAMEKLVEATEHKEALQCHATYFLAYVEGAEQHLQGAEQQMWLHRLDSDRENWRAAMRQALQNGDKEVALRFGVALWRFWAIRGQHQEGEDFLRAALALAGVVAPEWLARALNGAGNLAYLRGDYKHSMHCFLQCMEISRSMGSTFFEARALAGLANVAIGEGDYPQASTLLLEAAEHFEALEDTHNVAMVYGNLANVATHQGDGCLAVEYHRQSIARFRQTSDSLNLALGLNNLFHTLLQDGVSSELPELLREALSISLSLGSPRLFAHSLFHIISLAVECGHYSQAALLMGANGAYRQTHHLPLPASAVVNYQKRQEQAKKGLGECGFQESVAQGEQMEEKQISDYAFSVMALISARWKET